jgi:hypothetical protein
MNHRDGLALELLKLHWLRQNGVALVLSEVKHHVRVCNPAWKQANSTAKFATPRVRSICQRLPA